MNTTVKYREDEPSTVLLSAAYRPSESLGVRILFPSPCDLIAKIFASSDPTATFIAHKFDPVALIVNVIVLPTITELLPETLTLHEAALANSKLNKNNIAINKYLTKCFFI
ncbi:MAG: hypothetical protein MJ171_06240 [Clostridia bacterium]|nr:hypothetical protein [Clostridia bacterium]